jgi:hypothetical protein
VIIKYFLLLHELHQDTYDRPKSWIKTHNGFACPTMGSITLPLQFGPKTLNVSFSIILTIDQFHLRLGSPWLLSMGDVESIMYKCLKFLFDNDIYVLHHSGFNLVTSHGNFSLDYFFPELMEPIKPREDFFLLNNQKFQENCISFLSLKNMTKPPILDETMIKPKDLLEDQHKMENKDSSNSNKKPRDNQVNLATLPKVKQFYKEKEKVVEKHPMAYLVLPSQE